MAEFNEEQEWRALFARLQEEPEPLLGDGAPLFDDASARGRVGLVITRAMFGQQQYESVSALIAGSRRRWSSHFGGALSAGCAHPFGDGGRQHVEIGGASRGRRVVDISWRTEGARIADQRHAAVAQPGGEAAGRLGDDGSSSVGSGQRPVL